MTKGDKLGKSQKLIFTIQILFILLFIVCNGRSLYKRIVWNLNDGFKNHSEGRKFTSGKWIYSDIIELTQNKVPPFSKVYYFNLVDDGEENLSAECIAMELNYFLHPITVNYKNKSLIKEGDFIICQRGVLPVLKYNYREEIKNLFRIIVKNEKYIMLKKVEKSKDK